MRKLNCGLGVAAISYVLIDYCRHVSPSWQLRLQPLLWAVLALSAVARAPFYKYYHLEIRAVIPFLASMLFMLCAFLCEMISVRFVTAVLGLDYHSPCAIESHYALSIFGMYRPCWWEHIYLLRSAPPLPDTGQWLFLALNEKLPQMVVNILRTRFIELHHYLMLFMMLAFSVLFGSIKPPGLGLAARYMFTMAIGRLLRVVTFVSTILPSARPWCAESRYRVPLHPHPWAQKYFIPYASDSTTIRKLIQYDVHHATNEDYPSEYQPDWGRMSFLANFLRPAVADTSSWYQLLKRASGGCNDLMYSGHMFLAVLTAMAWTEAYGGWTSALIWLLVMHSAQREIRERHHYTVDCVVAIYVGILLWKMTSFIWSYKDTQKAKKLAKLNEVHNTLIHAAKDSDIDKIRDVLNEVELAGEENKSIPQWAIWTFACFIIAFGLAVALLAFLLTSDG